MNARKLAPFVALATLTAVVLTGCSYSFARELLQAADQAIYEEPVAPAGGAPIGEVESTSEGRTITYQVESNGPTGSVTWATFDNGSTGTSQDTAAAFPWSSDVVVDDGLFATAIYSLVAQADASATTITCRVLVDGVVATEQTATGAYAVATCSGTAM